MAEVQLEDVLKLLVRQPLSQTALAQRLNLSKSHVSFLVKNLLDQGYLERDKRRGRGRQYAPQAAS